MQSSRFVVKAGVLLILLLTVIAVRRAEAGWRPIGPAAGTIYLIVPDRTNATVWYVVNGSSLYISWDAAKSWRNANLPPVYLDGQTTNASPVVVHPQTGELLVITAKDFKPAKLWSSKDHGNSFQLRSVLAFPLRKILFHPLNPDYLIGLGISKFDLAISTDGGRNWKAVKNLPLTVPTDCNGCAIDSFFMNDVVIAPWDKRTIFVSGIINQEDPEIGGGSGLWRSTNDGLSWQIMDTNDYTFQSDPLIPDRVYALSDGISLLTKKIFKRISPITLSQVTFVPRNANELYGSYYNRVYASNDGGSTWVSVPEIERLAIAFRIQAFHGDKLRLLVGTDGQGILSGDPASGFHATNRGFKEADCHSLVAADSGRILYLLVGSGSAEYLFRYDRSIGKWQNLTNHLPIRFFSGLAVNPQDASHLLLSGNQGIWLSHDAGLSWKHTNFPRGLFAVIDPIVDFDIQHPNHVYAAGVGFLFKSTNGGRTFEKLSTTIHESVSFLKVDEHQDHTFFYISWSDARLYKSTDERTVFLADKGIPPVDSGIGPEPQISSIYPLTTTNGYIASAEIEDPYSRTEIFRTLDGAATWQFWADSPNRSYGYAIPADATGTHMFFFDALSNFYETVDGGKAWKKILIARNVNANRLTDPRLPIVYAGTNHGVYLKTAEPLKSRRDAGVTDLLR